MESLEEPVFDPYRQRIYWASCAVLAAHVAAHAQTVDKADALDPLNRVSRSIQALASRVSPAAPDPTGATRRLVVACERWPAEGDAYCSLRSPSRHSLPRRPRRPPAAAPRFPG